MTYMELANSGLMYTLVIASLGIVAIFCGVFFVKTRRRAIKLGVSNDAIKKIIRSSLVFTIVPSVAVAVGLFTLVAIVGAPWAYFRLSIIGGLMYELTTAEIAATGMGLADISAASQAGSSVFGAVMFIMSFGILLPPVVNGIFGKFLSNTFSSQNQLKSGKEKSFIPILSSCFVVALFAMFIPVYFLNGLISGLVLVTSLLSSLLLNKLSAIKGLHWMRDFNLALCLLIGMLSSLGWSALFG